jgi:hypothetical protein
MHGVMLLCINVSSGTSLVINGLYKETLDSPPKTYREMPPEQLQSLMNTGNVVTAKLFQEKL